MKVRRAAEGQVEPPQGVATAGPGGPLAVQDASPGVEPVAPPSGPPSGPRWRRWRAIVLAPLGDGQTRRRGSDGIRLGIAVVVVLVGWLMTRANSHAEQSIATTLASPPDGLRWLIAAIWWLASVGLIVIIVGLALMSRRWSAIRDVGVSGSVAWVVCIVLALLVGSDGGRPPTSSLDHFNLSFPVARVAATVAVATAALPYLSRWLQRSIELALGLLALAAVVNGSGLPVAVLTSLAVGWGVTALVHLIFGSPLGLPSSGEVLQLLSDLDIAADHLEPVRRQEWGVGRFDGEAAGGPIAVSVYGRDASDAQLLAKTARFLFYRDSGPTLALTRRQQVEHEAYLTLMAGRSGARVAEVLAAGPAGPAHDAVLVTRPPQGSPLSTFAPYVPPPKGTDVALANGDGPDGTAADAARPDADPPDAGPADPVPPDPQPTEPVIDDTALDSIFAQLQVLRAAGIAHGSLSTETIVVDDAGGAGFADFRMASTVAPAEQLHRDLAATLAAVSLVAGPERTVASAIRSMPTAAVSDALPFLQRAALDPAASKSLRGKKAILTALREQGAAAASVEVPKLIEPRRVSWVTLALVVGTLIGGWALIGVLINVTKSWSTITGAAWGWVAMVFLLAQAAYPAIAVTTVGSVTDPLPYGRTVALEFADTFVGLAGGSMAVLATRVRFFQQEGYTPTIAVSSGVLASTASWIVKGALFLIALPLALRNLHFNQPASANSGGESKLVWLIVIAVVVVGVALGLVFAVPRWRRLAAEKLRPK
ncbi:MAG: hypothetical protein ACLQPH_00350, partial [Acidimicrobiales bacterium]